MATCNRHKQVNRVLQDPNGNRMLRHHDLTCEREVGILGRTEEGEVFGGGEGGGIYT